MYPLTYQLQQDRMDGNMVYTSYEEQKSAMDTVDAANWRQPKLPISPCVRFKSTGEVHEWSEFFADRPELCENCDENGNTDPATWRGRAPKGMLLSQSGKWGDTSIPYRDFEGLSRQYADLTQLTPVLDSSPRQPVQQPVVQAVTTLPSPPPGVHFTFDMYTTEAAPGVVPPVENASFLFGIPQNFTQNYADAAAVRSSTPITQYGSPGCNVSSISQEALRRYNLI